MLYVCRWEGGNGPYPTDYVSATNLIKAAPRSLKRFVFVTSAGVERQKEFPWLILNTFGRRHWQLLLAAGCMHICAERQLTGLLCKPWAAIRALSFASFTGHTAEAHAAQSFMSMSAGVGLSGHSRAVSLQLLLELAAAAGRMLAGVLKYKHDSELALMASGLPYTILRPSRLTDGPYTSFDLNTLLKATAGSRQDVQLAPSDTLLGEASRIAVAGEQGATGGGFRGRRVAGGGPARNWPLGECERCCAAGW